MIKLLRKILVGMVIFLPFLVLAQGIVPCGTGNDMCNLCHFVTLVDELVDFLLFKIVLPVCVVALIVAGIILMTAQGSEGKITQGKNVFKYGILGLLIAFTAWLIVDLIMKTLLSGTYGAWNDLPGC